VAPHKTVGITRCHCRQRALRPLPKPAQAALAACAVFRKSCMSRRFVLPWCVAAAALAVSALSGCVVVPLDPRTGQPYPTAAPAPAYPSTVTVISPPTSAPQPPAVLTARLYPLNAQANKAGMLTALVVDQQGGRGSFSLSYLGENLQGEASRVDAGYAAFGRVHQEALGMSAPGRAFSGQRGIANGVGGRGTSAQCEYLITGRSSNQTRGTGACVLSDGAHYQMHFGS
jgi:hypothetical protein